MRFPKVVQFRLTMLTVLTVAAISLTSLASGQVVIDDHVALKIVNKLRLGPAQLGSPVDIANSAKGGATHREFRDVDSKNVFAYDVRVIPPALPGESYKIAAMPLDAEYAQSMQMTDVPTLASPQLVDCKVGVPVSIDVVREATGSTISDEFTLVDRNPPPPPPMSFENTELLSGKTRLYKASMVALPNVNNVMIYVATVGGFFFTLTEPKGYPQFKKAGTIDGDTLDFVWEKQSFEVVSRKPILPGGVKAEVWVFFDPKFISRNPRFNSIEAVEKWSVLFGK